MLTVAMRCGQFRQTSAADQIGLPCELQGPREFPGFRWTLASCRPTALIKRAFQDVSPKELEQLEGVLKKIVNAPKVLPRRKPALSLDEWIEH
jgi:hypothetical protein